MLSESNYANIMNKLDHLLVFQHQHTEDIATLNRHLVAFDLTLSYMRKMVQDTLTHVRRINPFVRKAMETLHTAFKMLSNGIFNLREEQSELSGVLVDNSIDIKII